MTPRPGDGSATVRRKRDSEMAKTREKSGAATGDRSGRWVIAALILICAAALIARVAFLHSTVFAADGFVNLQDNDPWYHFRLLEHQVRHFPHRLGHDYYAIYPAGQTVGVAPLFDLSLAAIIQVLTFGRPSQRFIECAAALYPPILSILVCLVAYAAGRSLFHRRSAGLIAATAVAVLPGAYFVRSALGYFDHHVMEVLLSTLFLYLLVQALRRADSMHEIPPAGRQPARNGGASHQPVQKYSRSAMIRSILAGLALGCYLLSWVGGNFLLLILYAWLVVQFTRDHLAAHSTAYLFKTLTPCLAVAALLVLPNRDEFMARLQFTALVGGLVMVTLLSGLSLWVRRRALAPIVFVSGVLAMGLGGFLAIRNFDPTLLDRVGSELGRLAPDPTARTITEARPLFHTTAGFSFRPIWDMFTTTLPIALMGVAALLARGWKDRDPGRWLLLIWSAIVIGSVFGQGRFSYYAAPTIALLMAYVICGAATFVRRRLSRWPSHACLAALLAAAFVPGLLDLPEAARYHDGPDGEWTDVLQWLRANTPEPFPDGGGVFHRGDDSDAATRDLGGYSIMSWWDYGYWISAIARRPPMSNPTQSGAEKAARFLLAQDEASASRIMDEVRSRYVVLDWLLPRWQGPGEKQVRGKFSALPVWTGRSVKEFYERVLFVEENNQVVARYIYYPAYYRTMCVRLLIFSGAAVPPIRPVKVYTLEERRLPTGELRKVVLAVDIFDKYSEARQFAARDEKKRRVIASENPLVSCAPLEPLERFRLVHQSPTRVARIMYQDVSPVRVFEYTPR